jgi:hypothetical protein
MTYFNHYDLTPDLGLRESIDKILASDCVTGDGIEKLSNYKAVEQYAIKSLVPTQTTWYMASYGSAGDTWKLAPHVTSADLAEIITMVEWLCESPILNETTYSDLTVEHAEKQLTQLAKDYDVDPEVLIDLYNDEENYPYSDNGEVELNLTNEALAALVEQAKKVSQTEHAHYYGGQFHSPEHCTRCQEFPQLIGARA